MAMCKASHVLFAFSGRLFAPPSRVRSASARVGTDLIGSARIGMARLGSARLGSALLCSAWLGSALLGSAWLGLARLGSDRIGSSRLASDRLGSAWLRYVRGSARTAAHLVSPSQASFSTSARLPSTMFRRFALLSMGADGRTSQYVT
jgi:hypothetical protein